MGACRVVPQGVTGRWVPRVGSGLRPEGGGPVGKQVPVGASRVVPHGAQRQRVPAPYHVPSESAGATGVASRGVEWSGTGGGDGTPSS